MLNPAYPELAPLGDSFASPYDGEPTANLAFSPGTLSDSSLSVLPTGTTASHLYVYGKMGPQGFSQGDLDGFGDRVAMVGLPAAMAERQGAFGALGSNDLAAYAPTVPLSFADAPVDLSYGATSPPIGIDGTSSIDSMPAIDPEVSDEDAPDRNVSKEFDPEITDENPPHGTEVIESPKGLETEASAKPVAPLSPHEVHRAQLNALLGRPLDEAPRVPLEAPSLAQLGLSLAAGLIRPRYGLQAAVSPFQAQLQKQAQAQALANQRAEAARQANERQLETVRALLEDDRDSEKEDKDDKPAKKSGRTKNGETISATTTAGSPAVKPDDPDDDADTDEHNDDKSETERNSAAPTNPKAKPQTKPKNKVPGSKPNPRK